MQGHNYYLTLYKQKSSTSLGILPSAFLCNQPFRSCVFLKCISMLLMLVQPDFTVWMQQIWWWHKVWQNDLIKSGMSDGSFGVKYKQQTSLLQDLCQFTPLISNYLHVEIFTMTTEKQNYPNGLPQETHTIKESSLLMQHKVLADFFSNKRNKKQRRIF